MCRRDLNVHLSVHMNKIPNTHDAFLECLFWPRICKDCSSAYKRSHPRDLPILTVILAPFSLMAYTVACRCALARNGMTLASTTLIIMARRSYDGPYDHDMHDRRGSDTRSRISRPH
jgi:hypothetical protein